MYASFLKITLKKSNILLSESSHLLQCLEDLGYPALVDALEVVKIPRLTITVLVLGEALLARLVGSHRSRALGLALLGHSGILAHWLVVSRLASRERCM